MKPLTDQFGRTHTYLRVSVTDRCNFRCTYCMPKKGMTWMPRANLLSFEEIQRLVAVFAQAGVTRVRLTGGEPLIRRNIDRLVAAVAQTPGIQDVALTTNAQLLAPLAQSLKDAGLRRINVSFDSLRPERFKSMTRGGSLASVLTGIDAARQAGLAPIKINAVLLRDQNDDEIEDLVRFFSQWSDDTELRFIEYMPFQARWHQGVAAADVQKTLRARWTLLPLRESSGSGPGVGAGPARTWRIAETGLVVGFISPLTEHFCASCNRLRLMADGHLRTCLAHEDTPSLRDLLRGGANQDQLDRAVRAMVLGKPEGHRCEADGGTVFQGVMTSVGG
ncbi:MAG: GTP 3',8-cyclase MoaA [Oligoflexia bacterium]|nr:GTP 3',8-cyclase MoaA [Oligoflexia bacterium]